MWYVIRWEWWKLTLMIHLLHSISLHICNQEEKTMARLELRKCMRGQILGREFHDIKQMTYTWACIMLKSMTLWQYALCSQRVLCVALCMMYYEEGDLLLCRPPPLAHSSIISLCLSVTHKPRTLRSVSYQHDSFYPYQPFPFLIDFRVAMAMFFEIPVFFTHPVHSFM